MDAIINVYINAVDMDNMLSSVFDDIDQLMAKESSNSHDEKSKPSNSSSAVSDNTNAITIFEPENKDEIQLKDFVYISKDCTYRLAQYIIKEKWGKANVLLYKYLDYIFRCQVFAKQAIILKNMYLVFNTGLLRRRDHNLLYILLTPNNISNAQKWRTQFGGIRHSFLSQNELLQKSNMAIPNNGYLPQRPKFFKSASDLLYDETFSVEVNWEERLATNQDRISKVMGDVAFFDKRNKFLKLTELIYAFKKALDKTLRIAQSNARLAVPQAFVDSKHCKYRMELLLPLIVKFPRTNGKCYKFALAISKSSEKRQTYVGKSILTLNMGYANARLAGYVDSLWLRYGDKTTSIDINNLLT